MKSLLIYLLIIFSVQSADFKSAEDSIVKDLKNLNRQLDGQRTKIFTEREELNRSIAQAEKELEAVSGTELSIEKELAEVERTISELEKSINDQELTIEAVQKQIRDMRRNAELAMSMEYGASFKSVFEEMDQKLDSQDYDNFSKQVFAFQENLLLKGFQLNQASIEGVTTDGKVSGMTLYSLGHAKFFLADDTKAGLIKDLSNANYPQMEELKGLKTNLESLKNGDEAKLSFDFTDGLATKADFQEKTLIEHFQAGGVIIYPLVILGLICLLAGLYKTVQLYSIRSQYDDKVRHLVELIRQDKISEAESYVNSLKNPVRSLLKEALAHHEVDRENLEEYLSETILAQMPNLDKFLTVLSVSAGAAPLLGLLGTVMGIIKTFEMIGIYGTGDANRLAGGISEALVTTEMGLIVAIPALIWHAVLNRRLRKIVSNLEKAMLSFINALSMEGKT